VTIASTTNRASYDGTGALTPLAVAFPFFATSDLVVIETVKATGVQTTLSLITHYTITGTPDALGHYSNGAIVTPVLAFPATVRWSIFTDPPRTQEEIDLVENDSLPAESVEAAFDYLTLLSQRNHDLISRSLRQPDGDENTIDVLPSAVGRASMYLGFDSAGDPVALAAPVSTTSVSAFMATVLDDANAAAARATLGISVTSNKDDEFVVTGSADTTKELAFEVDTNVPTSSTVTVTAPGISGTMALLPTVAAYTGTANLAAGVGLARLSGASFILTLPAVALHTNRVVTFRHQGTSLTQVYTLKGNAAETIIAQDGTANTYLLYTNGEELTLTCDGSNWYVTHHRAETDWVDAGVILLYAVTANPTKPNTPDYDHCWWRRSGKTVFIKWILQISSAVGAADGTGAYLFQVPSGYMQIDTSITPVGTGWATATMSEGIRSALVGGGRVVLDSTSMDSVAPFAYSDLQVQFARHSSATPVGSGAYAMTNAEMGYHFYAEYPSQYFRV
jgi:hypothetical protein